MNITEFIEKLESRTRSNHKILPPLCDDELKEWTTKFSKDYLPNDLLDLLKKTNGIQFWVGAGSPNGYFQILPLREIGFARQIMWGEAVDYMDLDEIPLPHWLAITEHQDGAVYIILDTDTYKYYLMDTCGADLTCPAGKSIEELLDYLWAHWVVAMDSD